MLLWVKCEVGLISINKFLGCKIIWWRESLLSTYLYCEYPMHKLVSRGKQSKSKHDCNTLCFFCFLYSTWRLYSTSPYGEGSRIKYYMKHRIQFVLLHSKISFPLRSKNTEFLMHAGGFVSSREKERKDAYAKIRRYIIIVIVSMFEIVCGGWLYHLLPRVGS